MFTRHKHETQPLTNGSTATLQIPVFNRIQDVILAFNGTEAQMRAELGLVRLTMNGTDIINCTVTELLDLFEAMGVKVASNTGIDGVLSLNVGRLLYDSSPIRDLFGWGSLGVTTIQVQVTAGTLAAISEVTAYSVRDVARNANGDPEAQPFGAHVRVIRYPQNFNSTGEHTVDTLPRDINTAYLAVMAGDGASGVISYGKCSVNAANVYEQTPNAVNEMANAETGIAPVAGYYLYNFTDGGLNSRLPMKGVTDLRFVTNFATAPGAGGYPMIAVTGVDYPANLAA